MRSTAPAPPASLPRPLRVRPLDEPDAAWDAFVAGAEGGTFSHLRGWRRIMTETLGHECPYLAAVDAGGALRGVLPLVHLRSRLTGSYLVSMPFLSDGGPLGGEDARGVLAEAAVELARTRGVRLLELRSRRPVPGDLAAARPKVAVHLRLPSTAEELWEGVFRAKLRSQIRRAEREGMEIRFGADQLAPFYEVFARNMRDLGTPVHGRRLFEGIAAEFPQHVLFGCVHHRGEPVAAGCGFLWRGEFEMSWASSLREHNRLSPNMLLYWAFMREVIGRGGGVFNFGRCTPGGSTHRFKLQWGGSEVPLPWAQWPGGGAGEGASPDRATHRLATKLWRRVPLPVANRVGPVLARRVPWF